MAVNIFIVVCRLSFWAFDGQWTGGRVVVAWVNRIGLLVDSPAWILVRQTVLYVS